MRRRDQAPPDPVRTDLVRLRAAAGLDVGSHEDLSDRARRAVEVATAVGAPLLEAIEGAAAAEADDRRAARAVQVATAQTRAVAMGLLVAPVLLVPGLGRVVDVDLWATYTTPAGAAAGGAGLFLLALGATLIRHLVAAIERSATPRRAHRWPLVLVMGVVAWVLLHPLIAAFVLVWAARRPPERVEDTGIDEAADLIATALQGGVSASAAARLAAAQLPGLAPGLRRVALDLELGAAPAPWAIPRTGPGPGAGGNEPTSAGAGSIDRLRALLSTATSVGAPAAPALRRLARDLRADDLARVLAAAERLPARLTFPTALCLLPGTLLLIGAPIVHAGLLAAGA